MRESCWGVCGCRLPLPVTVFVRFRQWPTGGGGGVAVPLPGDGVARGLALSVSGWPKLPDIQWCGVALALSPARLACLPVPPIPATRCRGCSQFVHHLASTTRLNPASDNKPAEWNALAMEICRSPILSFFFRFTVSGISSRLAITLSSFGTTALGMM